MTVANQETDQQTQNGVLKWLQKVEGQPSDGERNTPFTKLMDAIIEYISKVFESKSSKSE